MELNPGLILVSDGQVFCHAQLTGHRARSRHDINLAPYSAHSRTLSSSNVRNPPLHSKSPILLFGPSGQINDRDPNESTPAVAYPHPNSERAAGRCDSNDRRKSEHDNGFNQLSFGIGTLNDRWGLRLTGFELAPNCERFPPNLMLQATAKSTALRGE